jgi:hypothetical protein
MKADVHRCHWCQSENVTEASVLGSRPSERWFECSYCHRFFSVVEPLSISDTRPVKRWEGRRLILGNAPAPTEAS